MLRSGKIAISLPVEVLTAVEEEREISGESRSEFFRRAAEALLRLRREHEMREQYKRAYELMPDTKEEVESARRAASDVLAGEPWE
ncbi:MAG: ribbon-helix-helix protein, CopG family [Dehalococcoidia bacterium]|nr:ribbon-helix-helix protein, CopG family [Dehalococcoidia bacterium]